jgi:hypothetical protein
VLLFGLPTKSQNEKGLETLINKGMEDEIRLSYSMGSTKIDVP